MGASDNIMRGSSTFMTEMSETAEILRYATAKSLGIVLPYSARIYQLNLDSNH